MRWSRFGKNSTFSIFIDESGDFDFSEKGSKYFVMAGIGTFSPILSAQQLLHLKYQLLAEGRGVSNFHASPDRQEIRNAVFARFHQIENIEAHVVFGRKLLLKTLVENDSALHALCARFMIEHFIQSMSSSRVRTLVLVFDQALPPSKQREFKSQVKAYLKSKEFEYHIYFHSMKSEVNGQIADYVAWAKFKQLEREEHRPWHSIKKSLNPTEFEISGIREDSV